MIEIANTKIVAITPPAAIVDAASYTTTAIDTVGYKHCRVVFFAGATDIAMTALKVQESDSSDMSGAADITGAIFGTSTNTDGSTSALPSATDDNKFFAVDIALDGSRKRYLDLVATAGDGAAGTYGAAFAILSRPEQSPNSASEEGFDEMLRV
jgi:hypothetical protein